MKFNKSFFVKTLFTFFSISLILSSCKKEEDLTGTGTLKVEFDNKANGVDLSLGTAYTNASGEAMTFSMFNYYVSNFVLVKSDGSTFTVPKSESFFLLKETANGENQSVELKNVPAGDYKEIRFTIGVDSLTSTLPVGERTGVLDPAGAGAGMYWMWNSGYIFVKVEGTSPSITAAGNAFKYHIGLFGGYSSPTLNNVKSVSLSSSDVAMVRKDKTPEAHVEVEIMEMFKTPTAVSVATNPVVMASPYSANVANNYTDMFKLEHIHN